MRKARGSHVSPFSRLNITRDDHQLLQELAISIVEENFYRYEEFATSAQSRVDDETWKLVKSKENQHLFVERVMREDPVTATRRRAKSTEFMQPWSTSQHLPVMLMTGTVFGQLEDLMLGVTNPNASVQRVATSYSENLSDASILYPVVEPTPDEPYRSVILKWLEVDMPLSATSVVKNRDYVVMEATGMLQFANGEQVGFHLLHSIDFPETHALYKTIRGNMSICAFYRQLRRNQLDCFATGTLDPGGELMGIMLLPVAFPVLFAARSNAQCGEMKKLSWLLQKKQEIMGNATYIRQSNTCVSCAAKAYPGSVLRIGRSTCKLCFGSVCHSCKVRKKISFMTPDKHLVRRKVTFCALCINDSTRMSALESARDQAQGYDAYNVVHCDSGSQCSSEKSFYE